MSNSPTVTSPQSDWVAQSAWARQWAAVTTVLTKSLEFQPLQRKGFTFLIRKISAGLAHLMRIMHSHGVGEKEGDKKKRIEKDVCHADKKIFYCS